MKKFFKSKKFIIISVIFLLVISGVIVTVTLQNNKNNYAGANTEKENEEEKEEDTSSYKITFNPNGGSVVESITVKPGEKITKPDDPVRKGYKFVGWKLDDKDFNFDNEINGDITLTATWKKEEDKSSTSSNNTSSSSSSSSGSKPSSTINKINLNDYLSVTINYYNYAQPGGYYFITNLKEVLPSLAGKSSITIGWDDDYYNEDIKLSEWSEAFSKFTFDTNKENNASNALKNIKNKKYKGINMTITGGSTMAAFQENHGIGYKYEYVTISNTAFKSLNSDLQSTLNNFKNEFKNIFNGAIYVTYPGYGVYPKYDKLLTSEVCTTYNLVCDRW